MLSAQNMKLDRTADHDSRRRYRGIATAALSGFLGKGSNLVVSAATVSLTARYLGSEGFGLWTAISSAIAMFFVFDIGIANTLTNLISDSFASDDKQSASESFATALWLVISVSSALGLLGWICWPHINWQGLFHVHDPVLAQETSGAVAAAYAVFLVALPAGLTPRLLGGYQEVHAANFFNAAGNLLSLAALLVVIRLHAGLPMLVAAYAGAIPASHLAAMAWVGFIHKPWLKPWPSRVRLSLVSRIFHSGSQFFIIQIAGLVVLNSDNLVISHFMSPAAVLPYNVTWRLGSYITAVPVLVIPALWPALAEAFAKNDIAWMRGAYAHTRRITIAVLTAGTTVMMLAGRPIIRLWAGAAAVPSLSLLALMSVWMFIFAITLNQSCLLGATGRVKKQAAFSLLAAIVNLALSIVLIKLIGVNGVILATIVSYVPFVLLVQTLEVRAILSLPSAAEASAPTP